MSYGHHAFTRAAMLFFDTPIEEACGLMIDEVTGNGEVWTVDCDGEPLEQLVITDEEHPYQSGPCAD